MRKLVAIPRGYESDSFEIMLSTDGTTIPAQAFRDGAPVSDTFDTPDRDSAKPNFDWNQYMARTGADPVETIIAFATSQAQQNLGLN